MQNIPKIPIGNSFAISWSITQCEELVSLNGKQLKLTLSHHLDRIEISDYIIDANTITFQFPGHLQCVTGVYSISLLVVNSNIHNSWRISRAFELVSNGLPTSLLALNSDVAIPRNGLSAYELAVANGYGGTYDEWVEWYATPQIEGATDNAELNKFVVEIMNLTGFPTRVLLGLMLGGDITGYEERIENFIVTDAPACTFDYVLGFDDPETGEHIQMVETIKSEIGTIVDDLISFVGLSQQITTTYFLVSIANYNTQSTPLSGNINSDRQIATYCPGLVNIMISEKVNVVKTTADNAQTTADEAKTAATTAQTTADEAKSIAKEVIPSGVTDDAEINKYIRQMYIDGNNTLQLGTFIKKIEIVSLDYIADSADASNGLTITYRTNDSYTTSRRIERSTVQKYGFIVPLFRVYRNGDINSIYIEFTLFVDIPDITTSFSYTPETPALVDMRRCGMPIGNEVAYIARKGYMTPDEVEDAIAKALSSQSLTN